MRFERNLTPWEYGAVRSVNVCGGRAQTAGWSLVRPKKMQSRCLSPPAHTRVMGQGISS